jgi:hypothetical protein
MPGTTTFLGYFRPQLISSASPGANTTTFTATFSIRGTSGVSGAKFLTKAKSLRRWIPPPTDPVFDDAGAYTPAWYRYHEMLGEERLGGILGPSMTDVKSNVTTTQAAVNLTATSTNDVIAALNANAAALNIMAALLQASGTPGASQIPAAVATTPLDLSQADNGGSGE